MAYPKYPDTYTKQMTIGDKTVTIEVGKFSEQVSAAVMVTCGETMVHSTVALGRKVDLGYFPLSVEFVEKLYSAGIIKGSRWIKRDGRPSDDMILKARVIDRSLRPMFPDGMTHEVQVINTVLSFDGENDPDMLGLLGSCIALEISDIPFEGPLAGVRIGYSKDTQQFMVNPTYAERKQSDLDLIVSGNADTVVMVEAGANEVSESVIVDGMVMAQELFADICGNITAIAQEIGREKRELITVDEEAEAVAASIKQHLMDSHREAIAEMVVKKGMLEEFDTTELVEKATAELNEGRSEDEQIDPKQVNEALYSCTKQVGREMIINDKKRPDGRQTDEIRQIWCEVDVLPRVHGSAMFKRGATQALTVTTLGTPSLGQLVESIQGESTIRYMHHYNMPPYASGEAGRFGFPKRREIGHGALAQRALEPMLPAEEDFPYAMHVVSEIMSSNGSTSQASVCGSTMSLMAAGVPIKRPVAGIAMGLMSDGKTFVVLSDIQGLEDHIGDMDFKVAGTSEGITAIQMDIKLKGVPRDILEQALEQALTGRMHILGEMLKCIDAPRGELSAYAPKIGQTTIPGDKIGELIGPGGKMIKALIEETGAEINVDEDEEAKVGVVTVSSPDQDKIDAALTRINNMMRTIEVGEEFDGTVTRVESYGAFVEYLPGREGLVHVSEMDTEYVNDAADKVKEGDQVHVRVAGFKEDGKMSLSMLTAEESENAKSNSGGKPPFRGGRDGGSRGGDRRRGGGRDRGGRGGSRGGDRSGGSRNGSSWGPRK